MSRSEETKIKNVAEKFLQWKNGGFQWYDKETETKMEIKLPVKFLVLDTLSTVKGYSDANQSGFWSNEVRDTKKEILSVYTKKGLAAKGLYEEVKVHANCTGAKYSQSVYIALIEGDTLSLCNIQLMGAAVSAWIDFRKDNPDIFTGGIEVATSIQGKKGATVYQIPVFTKIEVSNDLNEKAKELDVILQQYLTQYFKKSDPTIENDNTEK